MNSPASDATGRAIPYAGKEGSDIVITPLAGYETDEWYQSPRKTQKITLTDPYWYDVTPTQRIYMLTIAFPLIEDGRFVGAVTVDFDAAPFQSDMAAISTPNNFFAVFTPQGTLLAHGLKDDAVSKNVYEMLGVSESEGQKFFGQELFSMERTSESTGLPTTYIFNPIKLKGIEQPWGALVAVSNEMFTHEAKALVLISLLIAVACGAGLIALMSFFIHKRVSAPLKDMAGMIALQDSICRKRKICTSRNTWSAAMRSASSHAPAAKWRAACATSSERSMAIPSPSLLRARN